jgi:4a-hydroxytetrahydrobiopterin dehydratase
MAGAISPVQFADEYELPDWRILANRIETVVRAGSFASAAAFMGEVAAAADELNHHPDMNLRYKDRVWISMSTHDVGGLSASDGLLAQRVSEMARAHGYPCEPTTPQGVELAIDTTDPEAIAPFWAAVLGYDEVSGEGPWVTLIDPRGTGPSVWFQPMDEVRPERNHIHFDVLVAADVAEERIAATIAAGGVLLNDAFAPSFWVLADAEGNEACVCTWLDRE